MSVDRLLEICRDQMLTGQIEIDATGGAGRIELRAGVVDSAEHAGQSDAGALQRLRQLTDGSYQVTQRLPQLNGVLGRAAAFEGVASELSLIDLMRHCEENALTCQVEIVHGYDRAELHFRGGMIVAVVWNGQPDEERIVDIVKWRDARYRVSAPPLEIVGRPVKRRAPTEPFVIDHLKARPRGGSICELDVAREPQPETEAASPSRLARVRMRLAARLRALSAWLESDAPDRLLARIRATMGR